MHPSIDNFLQRLTVWAEAQQDIQAVVLAAKPQAIHFDVIYPIRITNKIFLQQDFYRYEFLVDGRSLFSYTGI